jgi:plastocyanin
MTIRHTAPILFLLAGALLLLAGPAPAAHRDATTLHAKVGPGYTISLTNDDGSPVKNLQPGAYTILVDDESSIHDFHLTGPGVDEATDIEGTGTTTWNVTFTNGTYTFVCDAHSTTMKGTFTVGQVTTQPTAPPSTPTLVGVVGKNNAYKISLTQNGKLVKTLKHGTYKIVIHDDSSLHSYELDGPHGKSWTFTSVKFKGTKTFKLNLVAGKYKAYCAAHESVMFQHFTVK